MGIAAREIERATGHVSVDAPDGHRLHAEVSGLADAPVTVVFAHGWTMRAEFWSNQAEELGRFARVVTYDQRGHGRSADGFRDGQLLDHLGDDLRAVIEATTPSGPVVLVGHSMGGMSVLTFAGRHPDLFAERVAGVALVSTTSHDPHETTLGHGRAAAAVVRSILERSLATAVRGSRLAKRGHRLLAPRRPAVRRTVSRYLLGTGAGEDLATTCAEWIHAMDPAVTGAWFFALRHYDRHATLQALRSVPVLVLHGAADKLIPPVHGRRIAAALPEARLVMIPGAGHMLPLERPEAVSAHLAELVSAAVPGSVPAGSVELFAEEPLPRPDHRVVIVGTGFSGLGMAIQLKRAGIDDFVVLEKAGEVGGTWRENTYPGCACDVQSHLYSFSFAPNPDWSRMFAPQEEIRRYLRGCVERFGIGPHLRFNTGFERAEYDEATAMWTVHLGDGSAITASHVVLGLGALHEPAIPSVPGLERFRGETFHSARWDHDYDLRGKRVAVIGTGASAIQFVPAIAPDVAKLHLFQRTPPWILPKMDRAIGSGERAVYGRLPALQKLYRSKIYWGLETKVLGFAVNPRLMRLAELVAKWHIRRQIRDPKLRAAVTPDYAMGCKRILLSNDYYPALGRDHVELVTAGIREVREHSIVDANGVEREVDAIIFGTGFHVGQGFERADITGPGRVTLREAWAEGFEAYLGTTIAGFPNLYLMLGPNTGLGHTSQVFMIEAQVGYALQAIRAAEAPGAAVAVRPEVQRAFNRDIQGRLSEAVWSSGCASWYLDEHGVNRTVWPGFTWKFWLRTRRLARSDYRLTRPRHARTGAIGGAR